MGRYIDTVLVACLASISVSARCDELDKDASIRTGLCLGEGTMVDLMVVTEISSDRAKAGDQVKLRVQQPVMAGTHVAIPVGALAYGHVTGAVDANGVRNPGALAIDLSHIAIDDDMVQLSRNFSRRGATSALDRRLLATLAPITSQFARGRAAKLKAGDSIEAAIRGNYVVYAEGGKMRIERHDDRSGDCFR